jgi:hypothetical protein
MLEVNNKRYVYFDEDGNITSIKNNYKELGNYIVVDIEDVYNLITGKEVVSNYVVLFDTVTKQHILSHRYIEDEYQFDINDQIYLVPANNKVRPDVIITHSKKERKWTIELDQAIQDNLLSNKLSFRSDMGFSITKAHDPHVLYQYIYCAIDDLKNGKIKVDFASDLELDSSAVSVYTIKRFEKYSYEVAE